jgi:filamentous hemagglutinin family protein
MTKNHFWLYFLTLSGLIFNTKNAIAQDYKPSNRPPVADSTLIGTQVSSGDGKNFNITGGLNRGQTLFHSFQDFSVPTNGSANFTNPAGIRDIISRVTGGSFSDINGGINSNGANFFLINPNGIVFGPSAKLNVGRAFMASTANGINLVDGAGSAITFGTNPNGGEPLLTISPNVFFNVSSLNYEWGKNMSGGNGQIKNFGRLQITNPNPYIGLIGGNVSMNGGIIEAPGGRVELGGLSAPGTVMLGMEGTNLRAQFPTNVARGDVSLNPSGIDVSDAGGGDITITARNLDILGGSVLRGGIAAGLRTPESVAGDIKINATGAVLVSASGINNDVKSNSTGQAGNIIIDAGSLSLQDQAQIASSTFGQGNAGNVTVIVKKGAVSLVDPFAAIFSNVQPGGEGKGGNITIEAASLSMRHGAQLITSTIKASDPKPAGKGDAGNVKVNVTGAVDIAGRVGTLSSGVLSSVEKGTEGNGGNITIEAGSLSLRDGAELQTVTSGRGNAGTIKVNATDFVTVVDKTNKLTGLFVNSASLTGAAGDIFVTSPNITLDSGRFSSTSDSGKGGNIRIGGKLPAQSTDLLLLRRGGRISTDAGGTAQVGDNGGNIDINSKLIVAIPKENSDITANAVKGRGGNVDIDSKGRLFGIQFRPQVTDNSDITASSEFGPRGNVNISTPGTDPGKDSTQLPTGPTDASNQISQACSASNRQNKFTVAGRGGMPPNANEPLTSDVVWQDARATNSQPAANSTTNNPPKYPPPAVGLVFDGKGKAMLVAAATEGQPTGTNVTCPQAKEQFRIRDRETEEFRIRD